MKAYNVLFSMALLAMSAGAEVLPTYPTASGPSLPVNATGWQADRFAPRVFLNAGSVQGRSNVLDMGVDQGDGLNVRPPPFNVPFYNSQGRLIGRTGLQAGTAWTGSIFIPSAWATSTPANTSLNRRSDLFAFLSPFDDLNVGCNSGDCIVYAGVGFSNANVADQLTGGGPPRFRIFKKSVVSDGWINTTQPVLYDQWNQFCAVFQGTTVDYFINGDLVFTDTSPVPADVSQGPPRFVRAINVQNYNFGTTYNSQWSELKVGPRTQLSLSVSSPASAMSGQPVPVTLTVSNTSAQNAQGVVLALSNLSGAVLEGVGAPCASGFPCSLGNLAAGQSVSVSATLRATAVGQVAASARVTSSDVDCQPTNDVVQLQLASVAAVAVPASSRLHLTLLVLSLLGLFGYALRRAPGA